MNKLDHPISVAVYRHGGGDTTLGGITSKHDRLVLAEANHVLPDNTNPDETLAIIREHNYVFVVPWVARSKPRPRWAFGGNLIFTSDSRFGGPPLKVHDRDMSKES